MPQYHPKSVLAVDKNYMPMVEVTLLHAIKAVVNGRALILDPCTWQTSDSKSFRAFKIIVYPRAQAVGEAKLRSCGIRSILHRDNYECQWNSCPRKATTVDHIVPKSCGGTNDPSNLVACCKECNQIKGRKLASELGWKLKHPVRSVRYHLIEEFHKQVASARYPCLEAEATA